MAYETLLTKANALNASIHQMWSDGIKSAQSQISNIMEVVYKTQSDGPEGVYILGETLSALRDRPDSDEMIADPVNAYEVAISNKRKYRRIEVPLPELMDDKVGKYGLRARNLGRLVVTGPTLDMEKFIATADTVKCFDGQNFFSTSHPTNPAESGSTAWSNKITKAAGLTLDTFGEVLESFRKFPDQDGNPLGSTPTHILVPAKYEGVAMDIATIRFPAGLAGAENRWLSLKLNVVLVKSWTADIWMLADASDEIERPFVFQEREAVELVDICTDPRSQWAIDHDRLAWSAMGRYGLGVGYPTKAAMVVK